MTETSLRDALNEHLVQGGLPPDAGDSEPFAVVKLISFIPYPIPNTRSRKKAVRIHDLNHLISGYQTDRIGEVEISAWELASGGCKDYVAARVLDLAGLVGGLMLAPSRTVSAFSAGRNQQNFYPFEYEDLLSLSVVDARILMDRSPATRMRRVPAGIHLASLIVLSLPVAVAMTLAWYALVPAWLLNRLWRRARQGRTV